MTQDLRGKGCPKCSKSALKDNISFINEVKEIHGDKYDYSKVNYKGNKTKVCIICPEHGEFWQTPSSHLNGNGCPSCNNSILENEIFKQLKNNNFEFIREKTFKWLKNGKGQQRLDFFLTDYNIAIECQGEQHFNVNNFFGGIKGLLSTQYRDYLKYEKCKTHKIKLIYYLFMIFSYRGILYLRYINYIKGTKQFLVRQIRILIYSKEKVI